MFLNDGYDDAFNADKKKISLFTSDRIFFYLQIFFSSLCREWCPALLSSVLEMTFKILTYDFPSKCFKK